MYSIFLTSSRMTPPFHLGKRCYPNRKSLTCPLDQLPSGMLIITTLRRASNFGLSSEHMSQPVSKWPPLLILSCRVVSQHTAHAWAGLVLKGEITSLRHEIKWDKFQQAKGLPEDLAGLHAKCFILCSHLVLSPPNPCLPRNEHRWLRVPSLEVGSVMIPGSRQRKKDLPCFSHRMCAAWWKLQVMTTEYLASSPQSHTASAFFHLVALWILCIFNFHSFPATWDFGVWSTYHKAWQCSDASSLTRKKITWVL